MPRLLLVSNRLPVTAKVSGNKISVDYSPGGLATGLRGAYRGMGGKWIGWPGDLPRLDTTRAAELKRKLDEIDTVPVWLNRREIKGFYEQVSNGIIWPLFHYLLDSVPPDMPEWDAFRRVNEKFARAVAEEYQDGDVIWVHDYQLMLVPGMLRELLPDARIGFFLHIPFPSSEVFSVLPWREEILQGLLGADVIGFHTPAYLRHFVTSLRRVLGVEAAVDHVRWRDRDVRVGVYPMGIDASAWSERGERTEVKRSAASIRDEAAGRKIVLGIDRLDYTKGIPRRLMAIERLFKREPALRGKIRFVQVLVPSRENVEQYNRYRSTVDELVGRINGEFATPNWVPIHSIQRSLGEPEIAALYRAADVMLVTPLRDGMNLVAKEFVASRSDEDGVLILSEFAGAAFELGEALHVNPYDIDRMASTIKRGLQMPPEERRQRMRALRKRVMHHDVHRWVQSFLRDLRAIPADDTALIAVPARIEPAAIAAGLRQTRPLVLLLDYDGTLVPFAPTPDEAAPDPVVLRLIETLSRRPGTRVHIVSGRSRFSLDRWFGALPVALHAEHGFWSRSGPDKDWRALQHVVPDWKSKVRPILDHFTATTRGSFIEEKSASMAWHYRQATADFDQNGGYAEHQARELRLLLGELLGNTPLEVLPGSKVIEVRLQGVHKGLVVPYALAESPGATIVAIGDDRTDEDLFAALPPGAISVHVGDGPSRALYRVDGIDEARALLTAIAADDGVPDAFRRLAAAG